MNAGAAAGGTLAAALAAIAAAMAWAWLAILHIHPTWRSMYYWQGIEG